MDFYDLCTINIAYVFGRCALLYIHSFEIFIYCMKQFFGDIFHILTGTFLGK